MELQPVQLTDDEMAATKGEDGTVWIRCIGYKEGWKNAAYAYVGTVVIKRIAGSGWANATGLHRVETMKSTTGDGSRPIRR